MVSQMACGAAAGSVLGQNHGGTRMCTRPATSSLVNFAANQVQTGNGCVPSGESAPTRLQETWPDWLRCHRAYGSADSVVLAIFARLSQRQCAVEPVVTVGIDAQPLGR